MEIKEYQDRLVVEYSPDDFIAVNWFEDKVRIKDEFNVSKIFKINKYLYEKIEDNTNYEEIIYRITIGTIEGNYYKLINSVFRISYDFYISREIDLELEHFRIGNGFSIIKHISELCQENVRIGNEENDNLPIGEFERIIKSLPNQTEINKYKESITSAILKEYFEDVPDKQESYEKYVKNRRKVKNNNTLKLRNEFELLEIQKYERTLEELNNILENEITYTETQWEHSILDIILLIFPKYLYYINQFEFINIDNKKKKPDFIMIDFNGNIDLLEIKKSENITILSKNPNYRNNYLIGRDLSGAIMQIEKYIYFLNSDSKNQMKHINEILHKKNNIPMDIDCKIINPKGLILLGRSRHFNDDQKRDFEIIKRQFNNIVDILTYDDLVDRLQKIINSFKSNTKNLSE